ncbi:hypothetical protein [Sphingomonas sp. UYEF23]|uniref:hypothetical protein n=1 Tax=Sphingomonas sp. UYEF23 TaxID=1756408 RepID=UPI003394F0B7
MTVPHSANQSSWYVRDVGSDQGRQLWKISDFAATRMYVLNPETGPGSFYEAESGETIWECLRRSTPWLLGMDDPGPFQQMMNAPGRYHPRVARPNALMDIKKLWLPNSAEERRYIAEAQNQLGALIANLRAIIRVVQPTPATLLVYGHEIRNLLILAATEVEMHWRGILHANGKSAKVTTNDYVKLASR